MTSGRPVLFAVDDEPGVLAAVEHDLRRRYGEELRVMGAQSGPVALDALRRLRARGDAVALLLVDQRMPEMSGVELLAEAKTLFPDGKRVLLTAYADTAAAIRAINEVRLDHYLLKPWDPPEHRLYPVLDDLLEDWWAAYRPPFDGVRIVGLRWSRASHDVREFLGRNLVPYQWLDLDGDEEARRLLDATGRDASVLPVVVYGDGTSQARPSHAAIAERVGLRTHASLPFYDLVIVGAGPAGLAAAVYGASEGLRTVIVEQLAAGGQAVTSSRIENYLGFPSGLSGEELTRRAVAQATRFGAELLLCEATGLRLEDGYRIVTLSDGTQLNASALLIATGVDVRPLPAAGADRLVGAGLYYSAAPADALAHRGDDVFVVGAGNSAGQAALFLAGYAASVTVLVRRATLADKMSHYLIAQIEAAPNVSVRYRTTVEAVRGDAHLEGLRLAGPDGAVQECAAGALFVFAGMAPRTDWVAGVVERDAAGFILAGPDVTKGRGGWRGDTAPLPLETSVPGIFVAGDVRAGSIKRVAGSVGEGAMAVRFVHDRLGRP